MTSAPWTITGGHTFVIVGENGGKLLCVAFEPTKQFRTTVRNLRVGDKLVVQGSYVKNCLHLEKLRVVELCDQHKIGNPLCCNKLMKSLGRAKGYKCSKCKAVTRVDF